MNYLCFFLASFTLGHVAFVGIPVRNGLFFGQHLVKVALFLLQIQHLGTLGFQLDGRIFQLSLIDRKIVGNQV